MVSVVYMHKISRADLRNNRHVLFIFGDNDLRKGFGGQAGEMRGEPNSWGVRVKRLPEMGESAFYSDWDYAENKRKITEDLDKIQTLIRERPFSVVVIPANGIGTGRAQLRMHAPQTANFLDETFVKYGYLNGVTQTDRERDCGEEIEARELYKAGIVKHDDQVRKEILERFCDLFWEKGLTGNKSKDTNRIGEIIRAIRNHDRKTQNTGKEVK